MTKGVNATCSFINREPGSKISTMFENCFSIRLVRNSGRGGFFQFVGVCHRSPGLSGGNQVDD